MRILVLGASGRTGQQVISAILADPSSSVTAMVRDTSSIPGKERLAMSKGTPVSQSDISNAMAAAPVNDPAKAVIVTLGVPRTSESFFATPTAEPGFLRSCILAAIGAMREHKINRLVVLSMFGSGDSWRHMAWPLKTVFRYTGLSIVLDEHNAVDALLRSEEARGMEWTLVKPPMLKDGGVKKVQEFGVQGVGITMMDSATRESVAETLVKAALQGQWKHQAVVIANRE